MRFRITWRDNAYRVNIPNYQGGDVVPADQYDQLRDAALALLEAWDRFNDPKIRVGPVWPRMRDLRAIVDSKED